MLITEQCLCLVRPWQCPVWRRPVLTRQCPCVDGPYPVCTIIWSRNFSCTANYMERGHPVLHLCTSDIDVIADAHRSSSPLVLLRRRNGSCLAYTCRRGAKQIKQTDRASLPYNKLLIYWSFFVVVLSFGQVRRRWLKFQTDVEANVLSLLLDEWQPNDVCAAFVDDNCHKLSDSVKFC